MKKIICFFLGSLLFIFSLPLIQGKEAIGVIGKTWSAGFFEVAISVSGNSEFIYLSDTNNAQVQVFDNQLKPISHFGGYGHKDGQFISLKGIQSSDNEVFVCSITNYQKNIGKIQVFSKTGIFDRTFDNPASRSDFIRATQPTQNFVFGITEKTLCKYQKNGAFLEEISELQGVPFIDLKDIDTFDDKVLFIDSQRRGFIVTDPDLSSLTIIGEELISIPVAIEAENEKIFVADAKGNLYIFSKNGKHLSTIPLTEDLLINGLYYYSDNNLLATTSSPHSLTFINLSTSQIKTTKMLPSNPLELHWPSRICVNKQGILCTNDDFTKGIKCIDSSTNEYISHLDCRESFPELEFVNPTDICCLDNNVICFIDQNHTNQLYTIRDKTCSVLYKGNTQSQFNQIMAFNDSVYALDKYNQTLTQISAEGKVMQTRIFSEEYNSIHTFYVDSSALFLLNKNGMLYITPFSNQEKTIEIQLQDFQNRETCQQFFVSLQDRIIICNRDNCCLEFYSIISGRNFSKFGTIGGPNTYIQDSNSQIDLWYETGKFLFPEKILLSDHFLFVADSGNQRIQKIPVDQILETVIELQISSSDAFINGILNTLDVAPFILNGRTMIPLRFISESFQAEVQWRAKTQEILIKDDSTSIRLQIGSSEMYINDDVVILDSPPIIQDSRTFVPIRAISEALRAVVEWNAADQIVTIRRM